METRKMIINKTYFLLKLGLLGLNGLHAHFPVAEEIVPDQENV